MDSIQWFEVLQSLLYIVVMVVAPFVAKYFREKSESEKFNRILEYSRIAVEMAEKYYKEYGGEEKYFYASSWLANRASKIGIKLTDEEIRGLIESTLKHIEIEFGDVWKPKNEENKNK